MCTSTRRRRLGGTSPLPPQVVGSEDVATDIELEYEDGAAFLTTAMANVPPRDVLQRSLTLLALHGLDVKRLQIDEIDDGGDALTSGVTLLRMVVTSNDEIDEIDDRVHDAMYRTYTATAHIQLSIAAISWSSGAALLHICPAVLLRYYALRYTLHYVCVPLILPRPQAS